MVMRKQTLRQEIHGQNTWESIHRTENPNSLLTSYELLILTGNHKSAQTNNNNVILLFLDRQTMLKSDNTNTGGMWADGNFHTTTGEKADAVTQEQCTNIY